MRMIVGAVAVVVLVLGGLLIYKSQAQENPSLASGSAPAEAASASSNSANAGWTKRCKDNKDEPGRCEVYRMITVAETKQRFMEMAFGYPDSASQDGAAAFMLPLGIMVAKGGTIQADEDPKGKGFPVQSCVKDGCVARFKLDGEFMKRLASAKTMTVGVVDANGKPLNIKMPMDGFGAALASLKR